MSESTPLLNPSATCVTKYCKIKYLCLPSKSAILIILWTFVVGTMYTFIKDLVALGVITSKYTHTTDVAILDLIPYTVLAIIMTLYPLSGFIADVCCGRFKVAMTSLTLFLVSLLFTVLSCITGTVLWASDSHITFKPHNIVDITLVLFVTFSLLCFVGGLIGYHANYIQLGLDQLLEAPNEYLALFIHYATWAFSLSSLIMSTLVGIGSCNYIRKTAHVWTLVTVPSTLAIMLLILYTISCYGKNKKWFYIEPAQQNPYKIVCNVLNFARKHKHPLQRSAFTYSDDYIPNRLDFAKERYGGPYTTEEVENVKTLLRIIVLLIAIGPIHVLSVASSHYIFPLFAFHAEKGKNHLSVRDCDINDELSSVVTSGAMSSFFTSIIFFIYIWAIFVVLRRKIPKIFTRLGLGVILSLLGVFTMLIIDVVGHSAHNIKQNDTKVPQCMFQVAKYNYTLDYEPLNMHWSVLVLPSVLLGIGPLLTTTTILEFISAQSPYSMKGLLIGVSFAIQGFFQLLGIIAVLPLSLTQPWSRMLPPFASCGFVYLLFVLVIGLLGFVLLICAAKKYKYRQRDDINFYQRDIEDVYTRYLIQATNY